MVTRRGQADGNKEAFWRQLVARQRASRLSIREWCRREGIKEPAFYWWRRRLASQPPSATNPRPKASGNTVRPVSATAGFLPIQFAPPPAIEILLTDGVRLQVTPGVTADQLRQVLCALRADRC